MKKLTVDRFDGIYVICEDKERKMFAIPKNEMPKNIKEGDKVQIDDEGNITINADATSQARAEVRSKENALFYKD